MLHQVGVRCSPDDHRQVDLVTQQVGPGAADPYIQPYIRIESPESDKMRGDNLAAEGHRQRDGQLAARCLAQPGKFGGGGFHLFQNALCMTIELCAVRRQAQCP